MEAAEEEFLAFPLFLSDREAFLAIILTASSICYTILKKQKSD